MYILFSIVFFLLLNAYSNKNITSRELAINVLAEGVLGWSIELNSGDVGPFPFGPFGTSAIIYSYVPYAGNCPVELF